MILIALLRVVVTVLAEGALTLLFYYYDFPAINDALLALLNTVI